MADVVFEDNSIKVKAAIDKRINIALEECAGELESAAKRNTRVSSSGGGGTKNNWRHRVDSGKHEAIIGNPLENAIWEEFGKKFLCRIKIGQNRFSSFAGNMV